MTRHKSSGSRSATLLVTLVDSKNALREANMQNSGTPAKLTPAQSPLQTKLDLTSGSKSTEPILTLSVFASSGNSLVSVKWNSSPQPILMRLCQQAERSMWSFIHHLLSESMSPDSDKIIQSYFRAKAEMHEPSLANPIMDSPPSNSLTKSTKPSSPSIPMESSSTGVV